MENQPQRKRLGFGTIVLIIIFGLIGLWLVTGGQSDQPSPPDNQTPNAPTILDDPKYRGAIAKLISESGYECPQVHELWLKGNSPLGPKLEALCGDMGTTDSDPTLHYTIYPDHFQVIVCKPFGLFAGGCD